MTARILIAASGILAMGALSGCAGGPVSDVEVRAAPAAAPAGAASIPPAPPPVVRPLFRPLVRPAPRTTASAAAERAPVRLTEPAPERVAPTPPPAPEEPALYFVGVTVLGGETRALIEEANRSQGHRVREGETVGDYRVARITGDTVQLTRGGATRTLVLGEGKEAPGLTPLGPGRALPTDDPSAAQLAALPAPVRSTLSRVMPLTGELRRVREDRDNGQPIYRVERRVDGLDWEIRVGARGEVLRIEQDLRVDALPETVVRAANSYREGFRLNPEDTPRLMDRGGERYYEVELRQVNGRDEVDLRIAPSGHILGRG